MNNKKHYEIVENVLKKFPEEYRKNYITNKETVTINYESQKWESISGRYDNDTNTITIYNEDALSHELFHMAFRDEKKIKKKLYEDYDLYYDNGVSIAKYNNDQKEIFLGGLTEGFAEYLSRKCCDCKGQSFNYFFVDLLISIHGEEILKYPLQNNPKGLLFDERFLDIFGFSEKLDELDEAITIIQIFANYNDVFEKVLKNNNKEDILEFRGIFKRTRQTFKSSPVFLFNSIINEYEYCKNPMINRKNFTDKLETFLSTPEYSLLFEFDTDEYSVKEEVTKIINRFKKKKLNTYKK